MNGAVMLRHRMRWHALGLGASPSMLSLERNLKVSHPALSYSSLTQEE